MDDRTKTFEQGQRASCSQPFLLCQLRVGEPDKLGYVVEEILWVGPNYAIYRSQNGVYVHFSDTPAEETEQRGRFTEICPELCELRYLTAQMRPGWTMPFGTKAHDRSSLYDHNIAQAIMLVMENKIAPGKAIAQQALKMAVDRVTNDNTVRYVRCALVVWSLSSAVAALAALAIAHAGGPWTASLPYWLAGLTGGTGAMFSVATRLQAFAFKPCSQSNMNYWMSGMRIGVGVLAGVLLVLIAPTVLKGAMGMPDMQGGDLPLRAAAILGLFGGFAERLVPGLIQRTADRVEGAAGTPVQAARRESAQHAV